MIGIDDDETPRARRGYKSPPEEYRFSAEKQPERRRGKKPADKERTASILRRILAEKCDVTINGKSVSLSKLDIIKKRLLECVARGDRGCIKLLDQLHFNPVDDKPDYILKFDSDSERSFHTISWE